MNETGMTVDGEMEVGMPAPGEAEVERDARNRATTHGDPVAAEIELDARG